mgnify:CR=1 FL=1
MWLARVFTLYPELFPGPLGSGLYKKALEKKLSLLEDILDSSYKINNHSDSLSDHSKRISGTEAREMLVKGITPPKWYMRKELSQMIILIIPPSSI